MLFYRDWWGARSKIFTTDPEHKIKVASHLTCGIRVPVQPQSLLTLVITATSRLSLLKKPPSNKRPRHTHTHTQVLSRTAALGQTCAFWHSEIGSVGGWGLSLRHSDTVDGWSGWPGDLLKLNEHDKPIHHPCLRDTVGVRATWSCLSDWLGTLKRQKWNNENPPNGSFLSKCEISFVVIAQLLLCDHAGSPLAVASNSLPIKFRHSAKLQVTF